MRDWISPDYTFNVIQVKGTSGNANGLLEYLCEAEPGVLSSTATWRIRKFTYDSSGFNTHVKWASGDRSFTKIADDYSTYTYS